MRSNTTFIVDARPLVGDTVLQRLKNRIHNASEELSLEVVDTYDAEDEEEE